MTLPDVLGTIAGFFWKNGWFTILLILGILITIRLWSGANQRAEGGPRAVVVLIITVLFFVALFLVLLMLIAFATWVGPYVADFTMDRLETGAQQAQQVHLPGEDSNDPIGSGDGNSGGGQTGACAPYGPGQYVVEHGSGSATLREGPNKDSKLLGEIPNGTTVNVTEVQTSNEVGGICQRGRIDAVGGFPSGWVHLSAVKRP